MAIVKRISDSYSIVGTNGNASVSINGNLMVTGSFLSLPTLPNYTTISLPTVVLGGIIYVSDANGGNGTVAFGNATSWIDMTTGNVVV